MLQLRFLTYLIIECFLSTYVSCNSNDSDPLNFECSHEADVSFDLLAEYSIIGLTQGQSKYEVKRVNRTTLESLIEYSKDKSIPLSNEIGKLVLLDNYPGPFSVNKKDEKYQIIKPLDVVDNKDSGYAEKGETSWWRKYIPSGSSETIKMIKAYFNEGGLSPVLNGATRVRSSITSIANKIWHIGEVSTGELYRLQNSQDDIWLVAVLSCDTRNIGIKPEDVQQALSEALSEAGLKSLVGFCTKIKTSDAYMVDVRYQLYSITGSYIWDIPCEGLY